MWGDRGVELSEAAGAPRAERQHWAERALKHAAGKLKGLGFRGLGV